MYVAISPYRYILAAQLLYRPEPREYVVRLVLLLLVLELATATAVPAFLPLIPLETFGCLRTVGMLKRHGPWFY